MSVNSLYLRGRTWWATDPATKRRRTTGCTERAAAELVRLRWQYRAAVMKILDADDELANEVLQHLVRRRDLKHRGTIYAFRYEDKVKIGFTTRPLKKRLRDIEVHLDRPLEVVYKSAGMAKREKDLHARFAHARLQGEWFDCKDPTVAAWLDEVQQSHTRTSRNVTSSGGRQRFPAENWQ